MIRIFNPTTGLKLTEFRRGTTPSAINDLSFDTQSKYLTCTSDKGTIHIFKTGHLLSQGASGNTKSNFQLLSSVVPIAGSEWSFAQFRLDPAQVSEYDLRAVVRGEKLHVVTKKGWYLCVEITKAGGSLTNYT